MPGDQLIRCAQCGTTFVWTLHEQASSVPKPTACPACRLLAPAAGRQRGVVKWFSRAKGYGFVTPVEGPEVFVHKSGLAAEQPSLRVGQLVEFELAHGPRGIQAVALVVLAPIDADAADGTEK